MENPQLNNDGDY